MLKSTVLQAVATAKKAVQDLAIKSQLKRRGAAVYVPGTAPTYPDILVGDVYIVPTKFDHKEVDGDRIKTSDIKGLVFPESNQPAPIANDVINGNLDGTGVKDYRVINNDPVMAGDTIALSQIQLRLI